MTKNTQKDSKKINLADFKKIKKKFKDFSEDKKIIANKLIDEASFMFQTLCELKEKVETEGAIITTTNGNGFETTCENPAQKSYNTMIKNYNATLKQIAELLPDGPPGSNKLKELFKDD